MTYYIIAFRAGVHEVVNTCSHIAFARKKIKEMIEFDLHVFRYTDGYSICTENAEKERISFYGDTLFTSKTVKGAKFRAEYKSAIQNYKAEREKRLAMLDEYNAERQAFPNP